MNALTHTEPTRTHTHVSQTCLCAQVGQHMPVLHSETVSLYFLEQLNCLCFCGMLANYWHHQKNHRPAPVLALTPGGRAPPAPRPPQPKPSAGSRQPQAHPRLAAPPVISLVQAAVHCGSLRTSQALLLLSHCHTPDLRLVSIRQPKRAFKTPSAIMSRPCINPQCHSSYLE